MPNAALDCRFYMDQRRGPIFVDVEGLNCPGFRPCFDVIPTFIHVAEFVFCLVHLFFPTLNYCWCDH